MKGEKAFPILLFYGSNFHLLVWGYDSARCGEKRYGLKRRMMGGIMNGPILNMQVCVMVMIEVTDNKKQYGRIAKGFAMRPNQ